MPSTDGGPHAAQSLTKENLRRKYRLSISTDDANAQAWRRALRRHSGAQDGMLLMHEFVSAVRNADLPALGAGIGTVLAWSDRDIEEIWLAAKDDRARTGTGVDIEDLVHLLSTPLTDDRGPQAAGAPSFVAAPFLGANMARSGGHFEDSLEHVSPSSRPRPSYVPEEIPQRRGSGRRAGQVSQRTLSSSREIERTESVSSLATSPNAPFMSGTFASQQKRSANMGVTEVSVSRLSRAAGSPVRTPSARTTMGVGRTGSAASQLGSPGRSGSFLSRTGPGRTGSAASQRVARSPTRSSGGSSPLETRSIFSGDHLRDIGVEVGRVLRPEGRQYVQQLEDQVSILTEHTRMLNKVQRETEARVAHLSEGQENLSTQLSRASAGEERAEQKARQLEARMESMEAETQKLLQSLALEEQLKEKALEEAGQLRAALEQRIQQIADCHRQLDQMSMQHGQVAREKMDMGQRLESVHNEVKEARLALQLECQARLQAEQDAAAERQRVSDGAAGARELEHKVSLLEAQLATASTEVRRFRETCDDAKTKLEALQHELKRSQMRLAGAEESLVSMRSEKEEAEMRLEAVAKSRDSLVGNLRDAENRYADAAASLQQASAREVALKAELERAYEIARAGEHAQQVHGVMLLSLDTDSH